MTQSFSGSAGDNLNFTWKFLTNDTTQSDPVNFPGLQDADDAVAILTNGSSQELFYLVLLMVVVIYKILLLNLLATFCHLQEPIISNLL